MRKRSNQWARSMFLLFSIQLLLGVCTPGCGGLPTFTPEDIVREMLTEDTQIHSVCASVRTHSPAQSVTGGELMAALSSEIEAGGRRFLKQFQIDPACRKPPSLPTSPVDPLIGKVADLKACSEKLKQRFEALQRVQPTDPQRILYGAYRRAVMITEGCRQNCRAGEPCDKECTPAELADQFSRDPLYFIRLVDFSQALLTKLVYLTDSLDSAIDDVAGSFSVGQGVARVVLEQIAAEVAAVLFDEVLNELERRQFVNQVSVSRSACALYESGQPYSLVTTRVLKRAILRLRPDIPYPTIQTCTRLAQPGREDVCGKMIAMMGLPSEKGAYEALMSRRKAEAEPADSEIEKQVRLVHQASGACPRDSDCDIVLISRIAGILAALNRAAPEGQPVTIDVGSLKPEYERIANLFGESHRQLTDQLLILQEQQRSSRQVLDRLESCLITRQNLARSRRALLKELTNKDDFCAARHLDQTASFSNGKISSSFNEKDACDPFYSLTLDFPSDNIFESCSSKPLEHSAEYIKIVGDYVRSVSPDWVEVQAFTDPRAPTKPRGGEACAADNQELSDRRAEQFVSALRGALPGSSVRIDARGMSAGGVTMAACASLGRNKVEQDRCWAKMRRVIIKIEGGKSVLDPACQ